jgi:peptide/nickel transport system permease protein
MARFALRRLLSTIAVLFAISVLTFLLLEAIPNGDPALRMAGRQATATEIQQIRTKYGFDKPLPIQYLRTMKDIFTGNVYSYTQGLNVVDEIRRGLPATLSLALGAGVIWLLVSILIGTLTAVKAGAITDRVLTVLALAGVSFPPFFLGAVLIYYLGYKANIFPLGGYVPLTQDPIQWLVHLILPWFTLSVLFIGFYSRVLRSTILDNMNEDYVRAARAKGLSERQVLIRHVLRNSMIPIVSLWGLGVGQFARDSIGKLDVSAILVVVILTAFFVVVLAALVDVLYALLDPRIRLS